MMSQSSYPSMSPTPGFYGNFMHHGSMPPPQLPPLSSLDFPWQSMMPPPGPSHYDPRLASSSTDHSFINTQLASTSSATATRGDSRRGRQRSTSNEQLRTSTSPEGEQTEADRSAISDEKRRRNTAASGEPALKYTLTIGLMMLCPTSTLSRQEEEQDDHS